MLDRTAGEALLVKLDAFAAELARFRSEVVALLPPAEGNGRDTDDFAEHLLIDSVSVQSRFGIPQDTARKWARETAGTAEAVGIRRGGRWQLSIPRLRRHCGLE